MKLKALLKRSLISVAVALFWLAIWFVAAYFVDKELLLPYPHTVFMHLGKLCLTLSFWKNVFLTIFRILSGTVLASRVFACNSHQPIFSAVSLG